jgi:glycosyltransferase involved in cell wall biosynthesis
MRVTFYHAIKIWHHHFLMERINSRSYEINDCLLTTRMKNTENRLKIFTWHIHGSYLYYLAQGDYDIYIPTDDSGREGYCGRGRTFPFEDNVVEVPAAEVKQMDFDCILFQTNTNYLSDQFEILSEDQRKLPGVYVEHDPPWKDPVDTTHIVTDPNVVVVHVTHFNKLMWHNHHGPVRVIEHGVTVPNKGVRYRGDIERGIVVVNHLHQRGRKLGADLFEEIKKEVPLDLVGMGTADYGGNGEVLHPQLPDYISRYRFFFNPIRYTSLGLAVCEAMMIGMPVVGLATTEYVTVIDNGVSGFLHTNPHLLIDAMKVLLSDRTLALEMGRQARQTALRRFDINRFTSEWKSTFKFAIATKEKTYERENSIHQ